MPLIVIDRSIDKCLSTMQSHCAIICPPKDDCCSVKCINIVIRPNKHYIILMHSCHQNNACECNFFHDSTVTKWQLKLHAFRNFDCSPQLATQKRSSPTKRDRCILYSLCGFMFYLSLFFPPFGYATLFEHTFHVNQMIKVLNRRRRCQFDIGMLCCRATPGTVPCRAKQKRLTATTATKNAETHTVSVWL